MRPIIKVENLGKRYRIGERESYRTIRDSITPSAVVAPWRGLRARLARQTANPGTSHVWALSDVNFEVKPGEVLGLIGRNGAGKSTLLKVLSRITEPTTGRIELYGRVGSLLEVGTGFHPELTGRENIQLSGAIMGMRRAEIARKFDQIVAFAEIEQFVDTPVESATRVGCTCGSLLRSPPISIRRFCWSTRSWRLAMSPSRRNAWAR